MIGEAYSVDDEPVIPTVPGWHTPPTSKGGGPNSHDPEDLELGEPAASGGEVE